MELTGPLLQSYTLKTQQPYNNEQIIEQVPSQYYQLQPYIRLVILRCTFQYHSKTETTQFNGILFNSKFIISCFHQIGNIIQEQHTLTKIQYLSLCSPNAVWNNIHKPSEKLTEQSDRIFKYKEISTKIGLIKNDILQLIQASCEQIELDPIILELQTPFFIQLPIITFSDYQPKQKQNIRLICSSKQIFRNQAQHCLKIKYNPKNSIHIFDNVLMMKISPPSGSGGLIYSQIKNQNGQFEYKYIGIHCGTINKDTCSAILKPLTSTFQQQINQAFQLKELQSIQIQPQDQDKQCQSYQLEKILAEVDRSLFKDSKIVSPLNQVHHFLYKILKKPKSLKLLFQSLLYQRRQITYFNKWTNQQNTCIFIRTDKNSVIGAFNPFSWSSGQSKQDKGKNACIFSLLSSRVLHITQRQKVKFFHGQNTVMIGGNNNQSDLFIDTTNGKSYVSVSSIFYQKEAQQKLNLLGQSEKTNFQAMEYQIWKVQQ